MFCNLSPLAAHTNETLNSLRFATKVRIAIRVASRKLMRLVRSNDRLTGLSLVVPSVKVAHSHGVEARRWIASAGFARKADGHARL
jgi:hypothetical protein